MEQASSRGTDANPLGVAAGGGGGRAQLSKPVLKPTSLVDALHEAVRTEILEGRLQSGSPLTEKALSEHYDVARPTAKAALERLAHEGLLQRGNNKTARVALPDEADVRDMYRSRGFLEREVMRTLTARRYVPPEARQAHLTFQNAQAEQSMAKIVQADMDFHRALLNAVESPRLSRMYHMLMGEMQLCMAQVQARQLLAPDMIAHEHLDLLTTIESGDCDRAVAAIDHHLEAACKQLVSYMAHGRLTDDRAPAT